MTFLYLAFAILTVVLLVLTAMRLRDKPNYRAMDARQIPFFKAQIRKVRFP